MSSIILERKNKPKYNFRCNIFFIFYFILNKRTYNKINNLLTSSGYNRETSDLGLDIDLAIAFPVMTSLSINK